MYSVEKNITLVESCLWQAQREFFDKEGIKAWQGQVPFFVTSNPFIAHANAKLILAYLQDLQSQNLLNPNEPVYIFELGTGSGQFSFYCMQALQELLIQTNTELSLCYVLTDFTERNLEFWQQQKVLNSITALEFDFALFDLENPADPYLVKQKHHLKHLANPAVLIGNYIFDSVRQNYYAMEHGALVEKRIETLVPFKDYDQQHKKLLSLKDAKIKAYSAPYAWQKTEIPEETYLHFYETHLPSGLFSLPLGGFKALDYFQKLSPQGIMLISSDKGYNTLPEIENRKTLELISHGSFSLDVNFHALGLYFEFSGGRAFLQSYRDGIKTNVFLTNPKDTPHLEQMIEEVCENLSPADYFYYHRRFRNDDFKAKSALTQFNLGRHDPYVFSLFVDKICSTLKTSRNKALVDAYLELIPKFHAHIYPLPAGTDYYFDLGLLLHTLEHYEAALSYFEESLQVYGEKFASLYNLGVCLYMLGKVKESEPFFKKAQYHETGTEQKSQTWLDKIKNQQP